MPLAPPPEFGEANYYAILLGSDETKHQPLSLSGVSRRSSEVRVRHAEVESISGGMDDILSGGTPSTADMKKELALFGGVSMLEDEFQGCCYKLSLIHI